MKFKHCTACGSMSFTKQMGTDKCAKCGSSSVSEGAMDEINALQKSLKRGLGTSVPAQTTASGAVAKPTFGSPNLLKEKMAALKGRKTDDFEII